jgi:uncharacterized protein YqeY
MERAASGMQKENRGYLLTRDPLFIDAYKRATSDFYTFQGYLAVLVGNEPNQVAELDEIRSRLEAWVTQCARPEIEAESRGDKNARISRTGLSEILMNNVRHAIEQFEKGNRAELAAKERQEISILESYLPQSFSPEQLSTVVDAVIQETGARSLKEMSTVMKAVMVRVVGQPVDGKQISDLVRAKLQ